MATDPCCLSPEEALQPGSVPAQGERPCCREGQPRASCLAVTPTLLSVHLAALCPASGVRGVTNSWTRLDGGHVWRRGGVLSHGFVIPLD